MASKYQKVPFDLNKLGMMTEITFKDKEGFLHIIPYFRLKKVMYCGHLCYQVIENDKEYYLPILKITTLKDLLE